MSITVFTNGKFFTTDDHHGSEATFADCMVVKDGIIQSLSAGDAKDAVSTAQEHAGEGATVHVHDLNGRTVVPGFIDGHMHILLMGQALQKLSLEKCKSLDDIREAITTYARERPELPRILCRSWMHIMTDGRAEASMLDGLDPRPIFVDSKDLHSSWCSTAALKELAIENTPDPAGGTIHRYEDGRPTGLISESANVSYVWPHLAKMASLSGRVGALRTAIGALSASGYTGFIDMAMDGISWEALQVLQAEEGGQLPMRIAAHWIITPTAAEATDLSQVDTAIALHSQFNAVTSPNLRIAGVKFLCDGVVDACTAALLEPYSSTGAGPGPLWAAERLGPAVRKADRAGLQCALHAIGDAAVQLAIDTLSQHGTPGRRHRIEHLELTRPGDGARLAAAGITASIQPVHSDPAILRYWPQLLGEQRCGRAFAYREFADAGAALSLGSDAPTAPWDPLRNIYTATTRRSAREPASTETVNPQFALSLCTAVAAASSGSAYSCFAEKSTGSLKTGLAADFVVLDMEWEAERLLQAQVSEVWFEGRRVFNRADNTAF